MQPPRQSGSLTMLRALELISPQPSISCPGAARALGCIPCLPGLGLGWAVAALGPLLGYLRAVVAQVLLGWVATLPASLGISLLSAIMDQCCC